MHHGKWDREDQITFSIEVFLPSKSWLNHFETDLPIFRHQIDEMDGEDGVRFRKVDFVTSHSPIESKVRFISFCP
jgi:hypothetical protein